MSSKSNQPQRDQQKRKRSLYDPLNHLPEGTCDIQAYKNLQHFKILLSHPYSQCFILPFQSKYFSWIILKQSVSGQEPVYHLYYEILKKRFLSAQKQSNNIGCNFLISKKQKPKKDDFFVGKVRGNFRNTEFFVYDGGQNPKKKCVKKRKQLAFIKFDNDDSIFGQSDKKQKTQILVPSVDYPSQQGISSNTDKLKLCPKDFIPSDQKQNLLLEEFTKRRSTEVIKLSQMQNSQDSHFQQTNMWTSYFNQMSEQEQNLQRVNAEFSLFQDQNKQAVFSLTYRSKNTYSLNFGYPLNLVQGFGIALALIEKASS